MASQVELAMRDFDGTRKSTSVAVGAGVSDAAKDTLIAQMRLWTMGSVAGSWRVDEQEADLGGSATSPAAQQTTTLILEMKDSVTGGVYKEKIPIANVLKAADGGTNAAWTTVGQGSSSLTVMNTAHADYGTLKTAIEAAWESVNGNTGTLERGYIEN